MLLRNCLSPLVYSTGLLTYEYLLTYLLTHLLTYSLTYLLHAAEYFLRS